MSYKKTKPDLYVYKIKIDLEMLDEFINTVEVSKPNSDKQEKAQKALKHLGKLCKDLHSVKEYIENKKKTNPSYNKKLGKLEVVLTCDCRPKKTKPA